MRRLVGALFGLGFAITLPVSVMGQTRQATPDPQLASLRREVEQLKTTLKDLGEQLAKTKMDLAFFKIQNAPRTWVELDPTTPHVYGTHRYLKRFLLSLCGGDVAIFGRIPRSSQHRQSTFR